MKTAHAEMGAGDIKDTSPGAASGIHPKGRKATTPAAEVTASVAESVSD